MSKLSGGQMQRARFAVAVVSNPGLLLLDEPTAAMDVQARRIFWQSMRELTDQGRTVVFATHYLDEADTYADRVVMVSAGKIVADDTPAEIKGIVSGRRIRATFDFVWNADVAAALQALPGVRSVDRRNEQFTILSDDSDATLRRLLADHTDIHDSEVIAPTMGDAFLALTGSGGSSDANDATDTSAAAMTNGARS